MIKQHIKTSITFILNFYPLHFRFLDGNCQIKKYLYQNFWAFYFNGEIMIIFPVGTIPDFKGRFSLYTKEMAHPRRANFFAITGRSKQKACLPIWARPNQLAVAKQVKKRLLGFAKKIDGVLWASTEPLICGVKALIFGTRERKVHKRNWVSPFSN